MPQVRGRSKRGLERRWHWRSEAKCRRYPSWPWITDDTDSLVLGVMVDICLTCPAIVACRAYAAELEARGITLHGVLGGEVKSDRRELVGV